MAYKSDRLSRGGGPGWAPLIEAFEQAGCDTDHAVLTPSGWLSEFEIGIRASMDREESKKLSDRMRDVRAGGPRGPAPPQWSTVRLLVLRPASRRLRGRGLPPRRDDEPGAQ